MIKIHTNQQGGKYVIASELYSILALRDKDYSRNVKNWFLEEYEFQNSDNLRTPIKDKDYSSYMRKTSAKGGRPRQDYILSLELSKLIALDSRSKVKKRYAKWLLSLEKKVENLEYLSVDQVAAIYKILNFFKYISNQKAMLEIHKERFVEDFDKKGNPYAHFNNFRNQLLGIGKNELRKRVVEYCQKEHKSIKLTKKDKFTQIHTVNPYDTLTHAVIDWLYTQDKSEGVLKFASVIKRIAEQTELEFETENITNLFHIKQDVTLPPGAKLIT